MGCFVQLVESAEAPQLAGGQVGLCCPMAELRGKCGDELLNQDDLSPCFGVL